MGRDHAADVLKPSLIGVEMIYSCHPTQNTVCAHMTIFYTILMLIMLVFAGLQYNDENGVYWAIIYLVPAMALGLAAFVPHQFATWIGRILLGAAIIVLGFGVYVYWPKELTTIPVAQWFEHVSINQGFGVAIAYLFTSLTLPLAFRRSTRRLKKATQAESVEATIAQ